MSETKRCRRCRSDVPAHLATRIHTSTRPTGGAVILCPPCYADWFRAEGEAAEKTERGQAQHRPEGWVS